ncbi:ArdC family protein [Brevundimonas diminuta]|uniref:ArdC family protein n=1 Tax=Brevundimonas diminuta TaxID=293 RepID=UPI001F55F93B|nr:zincin-like metallopeptidase domain-containing protein [Brevundimonas diminuta]
MKADIYQTVTDSIIAMLERGVKPWAPGHNAKACGLPVIPTRVGGEAYRGINVALLWGAAEMKGYRHHTWMTFNQAKALGGCVRKGERSSPVVYWGTFKAQADDADEGDDGKARLFAKGYAVFNVEQIDGLPASFYEPPTVEPSETRIAKADAWAVATGADIRHGGSQAFYSPKGDFVQVPPFAAYGEPERYYSTLAHELTHWSGAKARLDRQFGKRFGDKAYAFEELVAEMGAAFSCARLGIENETREDHASYLASWLKVLKADKRAIFTAASKAQAACDYLFELADKAAVYTKPVEAPFRADGVICLPDLSKPLHGPEIDHDDDDTDPKPPSPTRPRPFHPRRDPSLCEFLSIRGVCDDGGELSARDLNRWHLEAPFRRRLVRPDGVSLERAAMAAWEAGHFPEVPAPSMDSADNMHPVTEADLLRAMEQELRADFPHVWVDHEEAFVA